MSHLWVSLSKGCAVQSLNGSVPEEQARILAEVENKVVAVDLSAWIMQAQTQPALLEHYNSPFARALKVVFDRVSWLGWHTTPLRTCTSIIMHAVVLHRLLCDRCQVSANSFCMPWLHMLDMCSHNSGNSITHNLHQPKCGEWLRRRYTGSGMAACQCL